MGPEFNKSLRRVVVPELEVLGFEFDGKRRFIKVDVEGKVLIIEFQVGIRSMQGEFTVNLISGELSERLTMIKPTLFSKGVNKLFGNYDPWWKGIFLPGDKWWKISHFQKEMDTIINKVLFDLKSYGILWLENTQK